MKLLIAAVVLAASCMTLSAFDTVPSAHAGSMVAFDCQGFSITVEKFDVSPQGSGFIGWITIRTVNSLGDSSYVHVPFSKDQFEFASSFSDLQFFSREGTAFLYKYVTGKTIDCSPPILTMNFIGLPPFNLK